MKPSIEITEPGALRALAHPTRLALVGLLRVHGTLTATQAAELLGLNTGAASFHLRQLARYGLVEEAGGSGRRKPWKATAQSTSWAEGPAEPEMQDALRLLSGVLVERYANLMLGWLDRRAAEPEGWQQAGRLGDRLLHVTPDELDILAQQIDDLTAPYRERMFHPESQPEGSRPVTMLDVAIPLDTGTPSGESTGS